MSELQLKEVREVVRKARASSAPGPSGTSYKVYKYCPKLLLRLWYILRVFWRRGRIPDQWRVAEGVWIPKEENSTQLDQFRIISLLCVEAKVFFSAVSKRLCTYLAENTYIDTSVQKGGISGMPGCLEHTGVVTQLIREARENKGNLSVLWLDLENAFGSIPHKLVQFTLTKHHVPSRCRDLIADYYSNFRMRVSSGAITSSWHKVEIGIITGCTISVTLFSLAMNMLTKSAEPECRGPRTNSGQRQPPIRAFMDDLTVMTESVPGCRWILKGLEELVEWARMRFKPAKSRSMVLRKGKVVDKFRFNIADTAIPSISEKPVKSLGKVFDCSLRDTTSIQSTCTELDGWLKSVDKSGLPGKFKAWVYQHGILPRILWPLLVYAVPISTVETLERRAVLRLDQLMFLQPCDFLMWLQQYWRNTADCLLSSSCTAVDGKAFEITYVRLKSHTSRPESFAIYKRLERGGAWLPYQCYSGSCLKTYARDPRGFLRAGQEVVCRTDEFSNIAADWRECGVCV
ncbi:hypothetical protein NHX12_000104 [Muraenolepis orangiensis]|uniref:Reverse transcriptase domain-containing protein n=1 Tax=Muraenolepis orangiensis TaxID=630683 RepID=A0A9Q0D9J5_9TELE|nr:hypothetical protein NHX12_000104 [Muraenolepis orangiensis]